MNMTPSAPKTDIAQIAKVAHEANRSFCMTIGDVVQPMWESCSIDQRQSMINGVLFRINNPRALPGAQHEAWRQSKVAGGWKLGPVKDEEKKEHPNLVPFIDLPFNQQLKDHLFLGIVDALWVEQGVVEVPANTLNIQPGAKNDPRVEVGKPTHYIPENVADILTALGFASVDEGLSFMYTHNGRGCWINNITSPQEIIPIVADSYEAVGRRTKINELRRCLDLPNGVIESLESNESSKPS